MDDIRVLIYAEAIEHLIIIVERVTSMFVYLCAKKAEIQPEKTNETSNARRLCNKTWYRNKLNSSATKAVSLYAHVEEEERSLISKTQKNLEKHPDYLEMLCLCIFFIKQIFRLIQKKIAATNLWSDFFFCRGCCDENKIKEAAAQDDEKNLTGSRSKSKHSRNKLQLFFY